MKDNKLKDIAIVTIIDNDNYGNRLQNYALSHFCEKKYIYIVKKPLHLKKDNVIIK
mgnify:CR=1 FL=1